MDVSVYTQAIYDWTEPFWYSLWLADKDVGCNDVGMVYPIYSYWPGTAPGEYDADDGDVDEESDAEDVNVDPIAGVFQNVTVTSSLNYIVCGK